MDALTRKDVDEIALLCRLELGDDEAERLRAELTAILGHMDALAALDTTGVEPMTHAVPMALRLRGDEVEPSLPPATAVISAPDKQDGQFRVPHVIKTATGE